MNNDNPYSASNDPPSMAAQQVDPAVLREVARRLNIAHKTPPTVWRTLLRWPGLLLWVVIGSLGCTFFGLVTLGPDAKMSTHWLVGFCTFVAGAALRDFGITRRSVRYWPAQSHFIDWNKVKDVVDSNAF